MKKSPHNAKLKRHFNQTKGMAFTTVDKLVVINYENEEGKEIQETTHYAWTTIYQKYDGLWKIESVTSTEKPIENKE